MRLNEKINNIRTLPEKLNIKHEVIFSSLVLFLGLSLGLIAKTSDSISIIGDIGTEIGIWIFIATLIASYSMHPLSASINVPIFFLGMLCTYYTYTHFVLGFFPRSYFIIWLIITLFFTPIAGFITWFSRGKGIISIVSSSLPIALLLAHGYPALYTQRISLYISLICGIILNLILPRTPKMKIFVFSFSLLLAIFIHVLI
ncbi:hypothetical protein [Clostridium sp.]|uniref:hypothetical protein n=1 Tax=Clostridium sp. TaxID=1506 RepID=UPI0034641DDF